MTARLLARVGLTTPEQRAWAWYDWANSAYFTTIVTAVFPIFFSSYASADVDPALATARFSVITTAGVLIVAVLSPILGALADFTAMKKRLLVVFMLVGVSGTLLMPLIGQGDWPLAATLFLVSNIGVSASLVFYDSLLPFIARPEQTDRVSSAGYALGYVGGGTLLVINLAWILQPAMFGFADASTATKASFASAGIWWLLFSIPLLRRVPEPPRLLDKDERPGATAITGTFLRLTHTFRDIRKYRQAFTLFLAMLIYQDGIQTIIRLASVYGVELGIGQTAQIGAFVMVQFLGIPFTFLFGALGARIGTKRAIFIALAVYAIGSVLAYFMTTATHFFLLAGLVATVQGGSQALSRSLFSRLIPANKSSEFFGFYAVAERFATALGPLVFAASVALTGSSRSAVLVLILFFVAGALLLSTVDEEAGMRAAAEG
ncbi:MAG: MFS transporter [Vicinamibacterales bacterium]